MLTLSRQDYLLYRRKLNSQSVKRNKAYRKGRKDGLLSIMDEMVKRIATKLDTIKDTQRYVIIPNVISDKFTVDDLVRHGEIEPINFTDATALHTRTMQAVQNAPEFMSATLEALQTVFPECTELAVKVLRSESGDPAQLTHRDFAPTHNTKLMQNLKGFHYSAIVSLQNSTNLLVGPERELINIPRASMLLFRGDMYHAGASYNELNERLFISISSHAFPSSENVYLYPSK